MDSLKFIRDRGRTDQNGPIPFPADRIDRLSRWHRRPAVKSIMAESVEDVMATFDTMSRRINDLARDLNCLGYFDDPNGDLPRAA